jgi:hypothetical protein
VQFSLAHGTFKGNQVAFLTALDKAFSSSAPNPSNCSVWVSATATAPIVAGSGTGAYKGITGSFKATGTAAVVWPKYTSGKKKGQCNFSGSAPTLKQGLVVLGSGTVSLG